MQKSDFYVAQMMAGLVGRKTGEISHVDYKPQKPAFRQDSEQETHFARSSPESCGISSSWITKLFRRLAKERDCGVHRILVLRGNTVIGETSFAPYPSDLWHVSHSLCKSVTGMAIGLLVGEGRLKVTDRLVDLFRDDRSLLSYLTLRDTITVEHLLTMSSGVKFNEAGAIVGNNWQREFMEAGSSFDPGTAFSYNSMNSYILSSIVTKLTGETMMEYLRPRLWEPLGIDRVFWEMSPEMITKGGWDASICRAADGKESRSSRRNGWRNPLRCICTRGWSTASCMGIICGSMMTGGYTRGPSTACWDRMSSVIRIWIWSSVSMPVMTRFFSRAG